MAKPKIDPTFAKLQASIPWCKLDPANWSRTPDGGWVKKTASVFGDACVFGDA